MIRPILLEISLFLAPFAAYALFLAAARAGVLHPESWSVTRLAWLTAAALVLMLGSFVVMAQFSGSAPHSTYIPAHVESGKFVPGATR